jgi:hypothetical protein
MRLLDSGDDTRLNCVVNHQLAMLAGLDCFSVAKGGRTSHRLV